MFVLERILRGLSEETDGKLTLNSHYNELLIKVKDLRINNNKITEYHEVNKLKKLTVFMYICNVLVCLAIENVGNTVFEQFRSPNGIH